MRACALTGFITYDGYDGYTMRKPPQRAVCAPCAAQGAASCARVLQAAG